MADLAREEADRFFSTKDHPTSHPEDQDDNASDIDSNDAGDQDKGHYDSDPGTDDDDDDDTTAAMVTMSQRRATYHLPSITSHANTGPKGVIADAQNFERAKHSTFRSKLTNFTQHISSYNKRESWAEAPPAVAEKHGNKKHHDSTDAGSAGSAEGSPSGDESDSEFMKTWRQKRLQELSAMTKTKQQQQQQQQQRRVSPSRRTWGTVQDVDAVGYLDAIEKAPRDDVVVVMICDAASSWSRSIELELGMLAYKYSKTRFVKLDQDIAEMESVEVPAVLAYRDGDVFATISGAHAESLEDELKHHGVLPLLLSS
ncbi:hypothetical protein DV737_g535, partial [Chaetothyriales sp. CBS 132003]